MSYLSENKIDEVADEIQLKAQYLRILKLSLTVSNTYGVKKVRQRIIES